MLPAPAQLYACPHCGKTKPMLSLMSCNTFGGYLWSDGRTIYPHRPCISAIQRCEFCGKYSLFEQWKKTGKTDSNAIGLTGTLSYPEAKEAYISLRDLSDIPIKKYQIALYFVHAYNDEFKSLKPIKEYYKDLLPSDFFPEIPDPTQEDISLFWEASQTVIIYSDTTFDAQILKAEMHRERGEWIAAYDILSEKSVGEKQWIVDTILYYTCKKDSALIPFMLGGKKIDYSSKADFHNLSIPEDTDIVDERKNNLEVYVGSISYVTKKDLYYDNLGGVYDKSTKTLLKLVQPSPDRYEIDDATQNIGNYAFSRNEQLKRVRFSPELKTIGVKAFYGCKNLSNVFNQKSEIEVIEDCAFMNCKSLTTINFIDNVKFIGCSAFAGMDKLRSISLPSYLVDIQEFTFFECESLSYIYIPTSVRFIASYAFQHTAITELDLPDSIVTLGDAVFSRCYSLETVKLPSQLAIIPERTFDSCKVLREISIPKNVKRIEKDAFADTIALERVSFCGKVESISETAFKGSGLKEIIVPFWAKFHYKKLFPNIKITTKII